MDRQLRSPQSRQSATCKALFATTVDGRWAGTPHADISVYRGVVHGANAL
jgi:hypothetical protein